MTRSGTTTRVAQLAEAQFLQIQHANYRRTDRLFAGLMIVQFVFGLMLAVVATPYTWTGPDRSIHIHVWIALALGGLVSSLPVVLAIARPGEVVTRNVVAIAQMCWSAILIHLTGGRIETHFHVFGSLAFLAFYRDWRILIPATITVAADHLIRQMLWPESVYGVIDPQWWRFLEHAGWVAFEDIILVMFCLVGAREMREVALRRAEAEVSHQALVRNEKLAAVGQLAASVGHELRNPLAAVRGAAAYVTKRLNSAPAVDPKIAQFLGVMDRELAACTRIISDLLDFARERSPVLAPCPLRPLVDEAIAVVPKRGAVELLNEVPDDLPIPNLDKDQFRQVIVNLVQNAVEAIAPDQAGRVVVRGSSENGNLRVSVVDNGPGIANQTLANIFEPLFTTKTKGTGLGLAIVSSVVRRHAGQISVESEVGRGTTFHVDIAATPQAKAA